VRSLNDALGAVWAAKANPSLVQGGGVAELAAAAALRLKAEEAPTAESGTPAVRHDGVVWRAVADALERIPFTLAKSAGLPALSTLAELASAHRLRCQEQAGNRSPLLGVEVKEGRIGKLEGVWEPLGAKLAQFQLAVEGAVGVLRVEDVLRCRHLGGGQKRG